MAKYYTLEEAARLLGTTADDVKLMARRGEVRPFQDRGTLRFRSQEIDELARQRGVAPHSDPELQLADESRAPRPADSPAPTKGGGTEGATFDFDLPLDDSDEVEIGLDKPPETPSGRKNASPGKQPSTRPAGRSGSDSDVRLVADGSDLDFQVASDSDVKMVEEPAEPTSRRGKKSAPSASKAKLRDPDSGTRLLPLEGQSDSDVKIVPDDEGTVDLGAVKKKKTASDSDIRLEEEAKSGRHGRGKEHGSLTEEIDLDAELRKAEEEATRKGSSGAHRSVAPNLPTTSPFELSDADLEPPARSKAKAKAKVEEKAKPKDKPKPKRVAPSLDSSDDFELTPAGQDLSPLELGSDEEIALPDEEVTLGELSGRGKGNTGINLQDVGDGGISLEQSGSQEDIELDMSPHAGSTPSPGRAKKKAVKTDSDSEFELSLEGDGSPTEEKDSDSDFELSLDEGQGGTDSKSEFELNLGGAPDSDSEFELSLEGSEEAAAAAPDSDSEFELSLEGNEVAAEEGSDSEFELTLDDAGGLVSSDEAAADDEKDIFETDFNVPALDEESGSEAVALDESDTDLETSDFDLALGEDDAADEGEPSGSQVVALEDEEEADDAAATVQRAAVGDEDEAGEFDELDLEDEPSAEEGEEEAVVGARPGRAPAAAAKPARWGVFPAVVMLPTVIVMILVGIMSWEMLQVLFGNTQGQKTPGLVTPWVAYNLLSLDKPKD